MKKKQPNEGQQRNEVEISMIHLSNPTIKHSHASKKSSYAQKQHFNHYKISRFAAAAKYLRRNPGQLKGHKTQGQLQKHRVP